MLPHTKDEPAVTVSNGKITLPDGRTAQIQITIETDELLWVTEGEFATFKI